ncbi:hypothetical protein QOZ80_5AG0378020 [Eleusine coracana subsp. coracana]|nr:hypothetical protein QOZ80_5AG0378020 [Eleusine coracana subsp. coracana]
MANLPCNNDGMCMVCSAAAIPKDELLHCFTCTTPWHPPCLSNPPALADVPRWSCPDCSGSEGPAEPAAAGAGGKLVAAIRAIQADETLSEQEKARRRQALLAGSATAGADEDDVGRDVSDIVLEDFTCVICLNLPEKPVTTPCGHNFCFTCFQKWSKNPKIECGKCRAKIPLEMAQHPRINYTIVKAISKAKYAKNASSAGSAAPYYCMRNDDRPDKAFTTDRAKKAGNANASSGRIFVTVTPDHFVPILAEHDPGRNIGVRVGETWKYRLECRQWGVHLPLVAGIAGQAAYGAQSVVISGGYEDDEDHGEWFLYTGRSCNADRSSFAPDKGLRPQKIVKKCPTCTTDICEFLVNPQVNCDLMHAIESLQQEAAENDTKVALDGSSDSEEFCYDALNKIGGAFVRDEEKYCPNDGSDGDGDASIKNVEIKEEAMQILKRKLFTEKEKEDNMMTSSDKRMKTSIVVKETDDGSQVVESYRIGGQ